MRVDCEYRVVKKEHSVGCDTYKICEVFYDANDQPVLLAEDSELAFAYTLEDLQDKVLQMAAALTMPVLDSSEIWRRA